MNANKPEAIHPLLANALSNQDLSAYLALYETGATLVRQDGGLAVGTDAIREEIAGFMALKGTLTLKVVRVIESGDIALVHSRGAFTGTAPDGTAVVIPEHNSAEVMRRQPDGSWLMIINNPWGAG